MPAGGDVEDDHVAGPDERQRAAGGGLGRDVQDDRPVGGAAHPPVADPDHVPHALLRAASCGSGMFDTSGMPG